MKAKKQELTPDERIKKFQEEEKKLLIESGLVMKEVLVFPEHKKPPIMGKISAWFLKKSGGRIGRIFTTTK